MKAQLLQTEAKSKRIKIKTPYEAVEWRVEIKKIQGIWYHKDRSAISFVRDGVARTHTALLNISGEYSCFKLSIAFSMFKQVTH